MADGFGGQDAVAIGDEEDGAGERVAVDERLQFGSELADGGRFCVLGRNGGGNRQRQQEDGEAAEWTEHGVCVAESSSWV